MVPSGAAYGVQWPLAVAVLSVWASGKLRLWRWISVDGQKPWHQNGSTEVVGFPDRTTGWNVGMAAWSDMSIRWQFKLTRLGFR
jgi:hypothetical protein